MNFCHLTLHPHLQITYEYTEQQNNMDFATNPNTVPQMTFLHFFALKNEHLVCFLYFKQ